MVIRNDFEIDLKRRIQFFKPDFIRINMIDPVNKVREYEKQKRGRKNLHHEPSDEALGHFKELTSTAEYTNDLLIKEKSRYRFCIYGDNQHVFIDVIVLDENGHKEIERIKDITHEQFMKWVGNIHEGEGLILDVLA